MSAEGGTRAIVAALLANTGIAVTKLIAFLLTGSSSMLAESVHSLADSGNQGLLLLGGKRSRREATPQHPFGFGRERYVYAFIVAIVLFSVGGLFALYEAWHKLQHPEPITGRWWWVPLAVLAVAMSLEGFSFRTAIIESNHVRGKRSWVGFIRTAKAPELPVILLEDFAALLGLTFALFGVSMTLATDNGIWDAVGTALIGTLLVLVAIVLAVEMKSLLLGEAATVAKVLAIKAALEGDSDSSDSAVLRVIHLRTLHLGPEELLVAAKLSVGRQDSGHQIAAAIDAAEQRARESVPGLRLVIYLEPDIDRGATDPVSWQYAKESDPGAKN
jgi:cation diffusion facilitator family transporter